MVLQRFWKQEQSSKTCVFSASTTVHFRKLLRDCQSFLKGRTCEVLSVRLLCSSAVLLCLHNQKSGRHAISTATRRENSAPITPNMAAHARQGAQKHYIMVHDHLLGIATQYLHTRQVYLSNRAAVSSKCPSARLHSSSVLKHPTHPPVEGFVY